MKEALIKYEIMMFREFLMQNGICKKQFFYIEIMVRQKREKLPIENCLIYKRKYLNL